MKIKGIDEYLEAAKQIKEKHSNVNFYVAGFIEEEKYKTIIEEYNSKGIIKYIGFQKDIKSWIEKCHCTVLPSHGGEGVPNVLLESSAMGRVCIASDINGSKDVIDNNKTGYLFEVRKSDELANRIESILNKKYSEIIQMGLNARNKVEKEFNRSIIIENYLSEVRNIEMEYANEKIC